MSTVRQVLYGLALLGALALLLWAQSQRIAAADKNTELAQQRADTATTEADLSTARAVMLRSTLDDERAAQVGLRKLQDELRTGLARRQKTIEELTRENKDLRDWAQQLLPDVARGLRERPAIIGAAGYRDWMSGRGAVHAAGDGATP
ncbi:Rz-like lysis system protein LysB [Pseudomonas sp. UBA4194]|uniref:Rz-like lysis system protein LysB n=1 Tax=Pseudomonas sp. UBA4194 TaxID=1947317 RepID=UPI0025F51A44|nr:Rz-like lysis system protein LysB [Pseudomonas sp. UBA4194]